MASNRHLGRIIALQTLYEQELRKEANDPSFDVSEVLARNIVRYKEMLDDVEFVKLLVDGVTSNTTHLDAALQPVAPEWPIDQIARMDRLVLRIGLYELENEPDVPPKVVINEAVELAKAFGGDNSSKFINGVLGTLLRQRQSDGEVKIKPAKLKAKIPLKKTIKKQVK
ncbi:MAG: transcription antitermination factor NusB [Candidatus Saccharimonadales bacterium]